MNTPWDVVAGVATAFVTLLAVVVGAVLSGWSQQSHWARDTRLKAYSDLLRAFAKVFLDLSIQCRHGVKVPADTWARWEQVLASLSLVAPPAVVDAALTLDETIWRTHVAIKSGQTGQDAWLELRRPLESARISFVNVSRRELMPRGAGRPLQAVRGRPSDDDPMWALLQQTRTESPDA